MVEWFVFGFPKTGLATFFKTFLPFSVPKMIDFVVLESNIDRFCCFRVVRKKLKKSQTKVEKKLPTNHLGSRRAAKSRPTNDRHGESMGQK